MNNAKIQILGLKPTDRIVEEQIIYWNEKPQDQIYESCNKLRKYIKKFNYGHDGESFAYDIFFESKESFTEIMLSNQFLSRMRNCTIHMEWDNGGSLGFTQSVYVDDLGLVVNVKELTIGRSTIYEEGNLAELVKNSEELFELAAHLSPKTYSSIHDKVYNNVKDSIYTDTTSLEGLVGFILKTIKDEIKDYEYRKGSSGRPDIANERRTN